MTDLHQPQAEPADAQASVIGRAETVQADTAGPAESPAVRRKAGNARGGKSPRAVALLGLGLPPDKLPPLSLRTADDQLAILEAVALAVAEGRTSGLVAQSLVAVVRAANQVLTTDQGEQIEALTRRIEELAAGSVVTVRR